MKKSSFTEEQIIAILKRADAGEKITDLCRRAGISDSTFHRWKAKYGGLEVSDPIPRASTASIARSRTRISGSAM